ncbi:MAG: hypothetical protein H7124_15355 [Phycisphaerales bacterium]|nr:hypothetical protein [Hyphomonadaceae bacterium]
MRLGAIIVCLALGIALGWIGGSLYPMPQAWLDWMKLDAVEQRFESTAEPEPAAASTSGDQAAVRPASRGAVDEQTLGQYRAWIREARARHPYADSEERMYAVMLCESRGQAAIVNPAGPYSGLFQYSRATWSGDWNTYRDQDILDPRAQTFATALAWSNGMQRQWGCYSRAH